MANFDIAYKITMKNEGGYANNYADKGGETYKGIARNFFPQWNGWSFIDQQKNKTGTIKKGTIFPELETLTAEFYYKNKWLPSGSDKIQSQQMANYMFDMFTLHGQAGKLFNVAINEAYGKKIVEEKNRVSADTINFINNSPATVYAKLRDVRKNYIKSLSDFNVFGAGWLARLAIFPTSIFDSNSEADGFKKKK